MAKRLVRGVLFVGLGLSLVHCGDDANKKVVEANDGGQAGETASSGGSGDPGDTAGAPTNAGTGGVPISEAGAPSSAGAGGAPEGAGGGGAPSAIGGESGSPGAGGADSCVPIDCCGGGDEPTCDSAWDADCGSGAFHSCCDPITGISKSCSYGGGGIDRNGYACINDCTGKSYGTSACSCLGNDDPPCDGNWQDACGSSKVYCSDAVAGYRLSCVDVDQYSRTIDVECVCDPDVPISG